MINCPKCNREFKNSGGCNSHIKFCDGEGSKTNKIKDNAGKGWPPFKISDEKNKIRKEKLRKAIEKRYENGWMPKAGRCKKISYDSTIAGRISIDGNWELMVAKYLDNIGVLWKRNTKKFSYINPEGKESKYTPDFWIEDWNTYIEVKGYKTKLDECKWEQFKDKLEIWDRSKLKELKLF